MVKFFHALVTLVIMLGVWLITLGLLGSMSVFTREIVALYQSSRNSLGFEDAVIVNPAEESSVQQAQLARLTARAKSGTPDSAPAAEHTATPAPATPAPVSAAPEARSNAYLPLVSGSPEGRVTATPFMPVTGGDGQVGADGYPAPVENTPVPPTPTATPRPIGAPERIAIPRINLDAPVVIIPQLELHLGEDVFAHWQAPDFYAAGWHAGSAFLGEPGNTVLSGHNAIYGGVFDYLANLQQGDEVFLYSADHTYRYVVSQVMTFEERNASLGQRLDNARWITPSEDERITLVSCWPPRSNSHRIIVVAVPVD